MMSQTSTEMKAKSNHPSHVIIFLNWWEKRSLEDIIPIFNSANWRFRLAASGYLGEIVFIKLLEAAKNPNIPFEMIKKLHILFFIRVWTSRV